MKKVLLLALFALPVMFSPSIKAEDDSDDRGTEVIDNMIRFIEMEKGHKEDWIGFMERLHIAKAELKRHISDARADMHIEKLKALRDEGYSPELLKKGLLRAIAAHKIHMFEHMKLWERAHKKAHAIHEAHKKDLREFVESLGLKEKVKEFAEARREA